MRGQSASYVLGADSFTRGLLQHLDDLTELRISVTLQWPGGSARGRLLRRSGEELRFRPEPGTAPEPDTSLRATFETPEGTQAFSTRVLNTTRSPWRLTVPDQLGDLASRGEPRIHILGSAGVTAELADDAGDVIQVGVVDLSHGGLALRYEAKDLPPRIGERLSCRLCQRGTRVVTVKVEVMHLQCPPGEPLKVGCRFIHARSDVERAVLALVERCAAELSTGGDSND